MRGKINIFLAFTGLMMIEDAVKGGGEGLHWLEPLVLRHADLSFTEAWHRIYDQR